MRRIKGEEPKLLPHTGGHPLLRAAAVHATAVLVAALLAALPVWAAETVELPLTGPAYRLADQAYQAFARADYAAAAQRAREALRLRPDVQRLHTLLDESLAAAQRRTRAAEAPPAPAPRLARRGVVRHDPTASAKAPAATPQPSDDDPVVVLRASAFGEAHTLVPPSPAARPPAPPTAAERAYGALQAGRSREAADDFAEADHQDGLEPRQLQDAAYASLNAGDAPAAARYFRRALDAAEKRQIDLDPQQRQDIRVAVADLERSWGASAAAFYRAGGTLPGLATQDGGREDRSLQAVTEAYWRPAGLKGFAGGGTFVDVYGRLLGTLYSGAGYADGGSSAQAAFGVRAKPFGNINLVGAAERLVKVGSASRDDWLLRLGYSDGFNTAPRVDRGPWWTGDVYAETGRYLRAGEKYFVSEARFGRSWRVDPPGGWPGVSSAVLTPHLVLAADYSSGFTNPRAVGGGIGVNLRTWLREDSRSGPRSYADLSLQLRHRLSGDDRAGGVVLRLSYNH